MEKAIKTTLRRREIQKEYNKKHNITPTSTKRGLDENLKVEDLGEIFNRYDKKDKIPPSQKREIIKELSAKMHQAAKELEFEKAAKLRDEIAKLRKL